MMKNPDLDSNSAGGAVSSKEAIRDSIMKTAVVMEKEDTKMHKTGGMPAPNLDEPPPPDTEV